MKSSLKDALRRFDTGEKSKLLNRLKEQHSRARNADFAKLCGFAKQWGFTSNHVEDDLRSGERTDF